MSSEEQMAFPVTTTPTTTQERLYLENRGVEALSRQKDLSERTCSQCFGRDGVHSQLCLRGAREKRKRGLA